MLAASTQTAWQDALIVGVVYTSNLVYTRQATMRPDCFTAPLPICLGVFFMYLVRVRLQRYCSAVVVVLL